MKYIEMNNFEKLKQLLSYIQSNVDFYKNKFQNKYSNINSEAELLRELKNIPIVEKKEIKSNLKLFLSNSIRFEDVKDFFYGDYDFKKEYEIKSNNLSCFLEFTSGTSGSPFFSLKTLQERLILGNYIWRQRRLHGIVNNSEMFNFIHNFGECWYPFPFERENTDEFRIAKELNFLKSSPYKLWHISQYKLESYSRYVIENNLRFENLMVIENNGSYISPSEKERYEEIFNCRVVDNYGCREVWNIAYDCKFGNMHVNDSTLYFELVDEFGNIIDEYNKTGYVVVTSLYQKYMPFVRYKTGDLAYYKEEKCKCGNKSRIIVLVPGRNKILGTELYGNIIFKNAIVRILVLHNLKNFESISVSQIRKNKFIVKICRNREQKEEIERAFIESANYCIGTNNNTFIFKYVEVDDSKNIFTSI